MKTIFLFVMVIVLTYFAGQWLGQANIKKIDTSEITHISYCDPTKQICIMDKNDIHYNLQFNGVPSALSPFLVLVKINGLQPDFIELAFDMEGMDMGYNKHSLVKNKTDWQAKVILPVCTLGRNDWILNVKMMFDNKSVITQYKFSQSE
ncbi:MAG: hypothetical protein DIZ80_14570 [endosymbiont of Galathealinum brachiosum]|uniref:Uncharacterized protein n=1 Tax=endosymbiont of Galathealinum brachiosum TaxID=2200906 RepID=A0A370D8V0_9GAMM|nr:MAG: hypothetical protein DIZ80_14570 [endosymbiont of Galathealinum brachiosum]